MKYLIIIPATLGLLLIAAGAVTGVALYDAHRIRAQLLTERAEFHQALSALNTQLSEVQDRMGQVERNREEALEAWHIRSLYQVAMAPPRRH